MIRQGSCRRYFRSPDSASAYISLSDRIPAVLRQGRGSVKRDRILSYRLRSGRAGDHRNDRARAISGYNGAWQHAGDLRTDHDHSGCNV